MTWGESERIPMSEAIIVALGAGLVAWAGSQFDTVAPIYAVLLARYRGRTQSFVGAFSFTLFVLALTILDLGFAPPNAVLVRLTTSIFATWLCALIVSGTTEKSNQLIELDTSLLGNAPKSNGHMTAIDEKDCVNPEEVQLRRFVDAMPAMIWRADPTGRIDRWNSTMIQAIGKSYDFSERFDLMSKIDATQVAEVKKRWCKSVRLGIPYEDTYRILGNDGSYHWHLVKAQPVRDVDGNIKNWYGVHTDIDGLKKAECVLQTREQELLGIIDTVPVGLWAASPSGEPTHVSRRWLDFTGRTLEEFMNLGWEKIIHPDDFEDTAKAFFRAIQTGRSYTAVHRLRRVDGEYRWHQAMGEPLLDSNGEIVKWYGLSVDIDERKRTEDHLRETRDKLNKAARVAMVAELSASIAHELNQPLMSIMASAQASNRWLAATPPNLAEASISIDRIVRDVRSADLTMRNIRAIFKREQFEKKEVCVSEIIDDVIRLIQDDPNKRGFSVQLVIPKELPRIFVDPLLIQEVFINLISNAIEAMESSPRKPILTIRATTSDKLEVLVEVVDNGPGVVDTEKIFDTFVTTKEKGMGIGLAVARSIVEAHEGQLWAANNSDFGAVFTVRIPRWQATASN